MITSVVMFENDMYLAVIMYVALRLSLAAVASIGTTNVHVPDVHHLNVPEVHSA